MEEPEGDLSTALAWLHDHQRRELILETGGVWMEPVLLRGQEPGFRWPSDSPDSYDIAVFTGPVAHIKLDPDHLRVVSADAGELVIETEQGRVTLRDDRA